MAHIEFLDETLRDGQQSLWGMRSAGPVRRDYPMLSSPEFDAVARLMQVASLPLVQMRSEKLDLTMRC